MEIQTIQSALAGIKRINKFLELPEKNKYDGTKSRLAERVDGEDKEGKNKEENISGNSVENQEESNGQPVVELKNVTFGYDEHVVLDNVSFAIGKGEQATLQEEQVREKVQYSSFCLAYTNRRAEACSSMECQRQLLRIPGEEECSAMLNSHSTWFRGR